MAVVLLQETFLKPIHVLNLPGYTFFRKDRQGKQGGVALGVRKDICARVIDFNTKLEAVGAEWRVCFISLYRLGSTPFTKTDLDSLFAFPRSIVGGDFNAKNTAWGSRISNKDDNDLILWVKSVKGIGVWGPADPTSIPSFPSLNRWGLSKEEQGLIREKHEYKRKWHRSKKGSRPKHISKFANKSER